MDPPFPSRRCDRGRFGGVFRPRPQPNAPRDRFRASTATPRTTPPATTRTDHPQTPFGVRDIASHNLNHIPTTTKTPQTLITGITASMPCVLLSAQDPRAARLGVPRAGAAAGFRHRRPVAWGGPPSPAAGGRPPHPFRRGWATRKRLSRPRRTAHRGSPPGPGRIPCAAHTPWRRTAGAPFPDCPGGPDGVARIPILG